MFFTLITVLLMAYSFYATATENKSTTNTSKTEDKDKNKKDKKSEADTEKKPPVEKPKLKNIELQKMHLISSYLAEENTTWLQDNQEKFLGIYYADSTGIPSGAVLIIYNMENYDSQSPAINELNNALPNYGWHTLAIPVKLSKKRPGFLDALKNETMAQASADDKNANDSKKEDDAAPTTADESAKTSSPENLPDANNAAPAVNLGELTQEENGVQNAPIKDQEENTPQNMARLKAATDFFQKMGIYNVVLLTIDNTAETTYNFISDHLKNHEIGTLNSLQGLIILNNLNTSPQKLFYVSSNLIPDMPILDVYVGRKLEFTSQQKSRQATINKNRFKSYRQISVPETSPLLKQNGSGFAERIRSWLALNAKGMIRPNRDPNEVTAEPE